MALDIHVNIIFWQLLHLKKIIIHIHIHVSEYVFIFACLVDFWLSKIFYSLSNMELMNFEKPF